MRSDLLISPTLQNNNFDVLRFALAVTVIYSHCYVIYYGKTIDVEPFMVITQNQADLGSVAVNCFFAISGFLIVRSFQNTSSIPSYLKKRILRIYPGFLVAFALSMLVIAPLSTIDNSHPQGNVTAYFQEFRGKAFLLNLFTLQTQRAPWSFQDNPLPNMINESLWTIQYEFICYLIVPVLALLGLLKGKWQPLVLFGISYLFFALQEVAHWFQWENYQGRIMSHPLYLPKFITYFMAGACFFLYRNHIKRSFGLIIVSIVALIVSCIWLPYFNLVAPFAGSYVLFYLAYHPTLPFPRFARKGDFSYGLYLYAWPVQQLVLAIAGEHLNIYLLFILSGFISFIAAFVSWHVVEKPFLKLKKEGSGQPLPTTNNLEMSYIKNN
ncbi:acyltransferase family protein [Sabulibacter ruber]|uniref:acyltransferase family protein n=1 Tax=Sabulibacter ruber TaxID=2811901 RepID=UPI001A97C7A4|nr:acyltransferase [Sabulibacter ruber]